MNSVRKTISVLVVTLVFVSAVVGQYTPRRECGTEVSAKQRDAELARHAKGSLRPLAPQANRPFWVPLSIHVVRRTDGSGGLSDLDLQAGLADLNRNWAPVGVRFYQHGATDFISDDYFYSIPDNQTRRDELRLVNPFPDTINVYFMGNLEGLCGQSTFSNDPIQGVLIDNDCIGVGKSPSTLAHEIGHYFDLYHTHETIFGPACPNGADCQLNGDLLCDTPADPTLDFEADVTEICLWTGAATPPPGCGPTAYNPSTLNLMSYSRRTCRTLFTPNQISKALTVLTVARPNLFNVKLRYVAPDGGANADCSYFTPCRTLQRAIDTALPGDTILLLAGSYPSVPLPQNKPVTIRKWNTDAGDPIINEE